MRWWMVAAIAISIGLAGCMPPPPPEPINSIHAIDQAKLTAVEANMKIDPILAGCVIKVSAQNDLCVLDGQVPSQASKDLAETLARRVEGITKVANHLVVVQEESPQPSSSQGF